MVERFLAEYSRPQTIRQHRYHLASLSATTGWNHPHEMSVGGLVRWTTGDDRPSGPYANNTVRQRLALVRTWTTWCAENGVPVPTGLQRTLTQLRKSYPAILGKQQSKNPAARLTAEQTRRLYAACSDGTWRGSRDQVAIRLLGLGLRNTEVRQLRWRELLPDNSIQTIGKRRQLRRVFPGPTLLRQLAAWKRHQKQALGDLWTDDTPILTGFRRGGGLDRRATPLSAFRLQQIIAERAARADLQHVAPHDMRRTLAKRMYDTRDERTDARRYDIADIAAVLGQSPRSIGMTQECYIGPLDTQAAEEAGGLMD